MREGFDPMAGGYSAKGGGGIPTRGPKGGTGIVQPERALPDGIMDARILRLEPGDILMVTVPGYVTIDRIDRTIKELQECVGEDIKVLVAQEGVELTVVRAP